MNQDYEQQYNLSLYINAIREHLLKQGFFEHHLYSTLNYNIENTDTFKFKENLYLRYNPEPDIWQVGLRYDKFFWIGSMFRDEKELSNLHRNEFTVIDIYQPQGTMDDVVKKYIELLKVLEEKLNLSNLSGLGVKYMTHEEFANLDKKNLNGQYWLIVTDYPTDESFYDAQGIDANHTQKFEIFLINEGESIEIAACGKLGANLNEINRISQGESFINQELIEKGFIGFGFGLERLMSVYKK